MIFEFKFCSTLFPSRLGAQGAKLERLRNTDASLRILLHLMWSGGIPVAGNRAGSHPGWGAGHDGGGQSSAGQVSTGKND